MKQTPHDNVRIFAICNKIYRIGWKKGKPYLLDAEKSKSHNKWLSEGMLTGARTAANKFYREPVLVYGNVYGGGNEWRPVILDPYRIAGLFDLNKLYADIYTFVGWLKDNPELPDNQSNDDKITSAGHDTKTSFRGGGGKNRKKKKK